MSPKAETNLHHPRGSAHSPSGDRPNHIGAYQSIRAATAAIAVTALFLLLVLPLVAAAH
ncbi:hypothetical protein [Micromonospora sp. CPCC 206061]|uniref:hypothetical protein n=1 Tax=Micromonospora sp. CPCC 206061 TaxID=3122410 RepID=UPI002FF360F0